MKALKYNLLYLFLLPIIGLAQGKFKEKTYKKSFEVDRDATLRLKNKYGDIAILTWDKNTIEIHASIRVYGKKESAIEDRLEKIKIVFDSNYKQVSAETIFEQSNFFSWNFWGNDNTKIKTHYQVKMPVSNGLIIENKYGDLTLDNLEGSSKIDMSYGNIDIGKLTNTKNEIELDYAPSSFIEYVNGIDLDLDYSGLTIEKGNNVRLLSDYTNFLSGEINLLQSDCDYGSIKIDTVSYYTGELDYVTARFGSVKRKFKADTDYGSIRIGHLENTFSNVDIDADYTNIRIGVSPSANYHFETFMSYGDIQYPKTAIITEKKTKNFKSNYKGYVGDSSSSSSIRLDGSYGSFKISELSK